MDSTIVNLLDQSAARYGVDPGLAVAVAQQESGGNPHAVSSAGAMGVMQLMPATAAALGVSDPFDPAQNIDAGIRYLSSMLSEFGDPALALAAYNWGPSKVSKNGYANWPAETKNYVSSILGPAALMSPPAPPPTIDAATGQVISAAPSTTMSWGMMAAIAAGVIGVLWIVSAATD